MDPPTSSSPVLEGLSPLRASYSSAGLIPFIIPAIPVVGQFELPAANSFSGRRSASHLGHNPQVEREAAVPWVARPQEGQIHVLHGAGPLHPQCGIGGNGGIRASFGDIQWTDAIRKEPP